MAWKKDVFTTQTCSSGCVSTTAGVFAFSGPQQWNSQLLYSPHEKICIAFGCFKYLVSTESIPSLKSKTWHPSHNFSPLQIPHSLTFTDIYSQPQRTGLSFLPFSLVSGLNLVVYTFKYSLINIGLPWPCLSPSQCIKIENPWVNLTIDLLHFYV